DAEVRFASAADRAAFAEELSRTVAALVGRYHDESAPGGRTHRVVVGLHQIPDPAGPPGATGAPPATNSEAAEEDRR
ncbi:ArsR family transcriptional regulator, partial [Kitasatospora sp. NPDC058263]